jgi:REP element-mobilizing transposase RayT
MVIKRRKQIRLKNFDYSDAGWYFVTICTQNRECLFGNIINNQMNLNKLGKIVNQFWTRIQKHFYNVELDDYQIMPNHIHGIIVIRNFSVGAGFPRPVNKLRPTLGQIIGYYKYQTTKHINILINGSGNPIVIGSEDPTPTQKHKFKQIFQRSFYEHIIRNEYDLNRIRGYIKDNPKNWETDRNNLASRF